MSATAPISTSQIVSRIAASLLGGWLFVWGCITLGIGLGLKAGFPYHDVEELTSLLAFLIFLTVFCWAFAAASVVRVWLVLAGGGAAMTAIAWAITR